MTNITEKSARRFAIVYILIVFFFAIFILNRWVLREVENKEKQPQYKQVRQSKESPPKHDSINDSAKSVSEGFLVNEGKVTRKTRLGSKKGLYFESIFYRGNVEIARFKESGGNVYDQTGEIPDGKVEFANEYTKTYGEEFYKDGKRHNLSREYYETGQLKKKIEYFHGRIRTSKEYYIDGTLRMEHNSKGAIWDTDQKERGIGKIYYPDGKLKYEWHLTNADPRGYIKSYSRNGKLESENYFDENGNLIETSKKDQEK